jgi:hypothetical protein
VKKVVSYISDLLEPLRRRSSLGVRRARGESIWVAFKRFFPTVTTSSKKRGA